MNRFAWVAISLALAMGGCGLSPQARQDIIDAAGEAVGARVEKELRAALDAQIVSAMEEAKKSGATSEQLAAIEQKLRSEAETGILLARTEAADTASKLADRTTPQPEPEGGGWLGKLIAVGLQALLMALSGGKKVMT